MGMWPHVQLSFDLVKGCGNSAKSGAIPRKNWPSGQDCIETMSAAWSGESETWLSKISSSWQRRSPSSRAICLLTSPDGTFRYSLEINNFVLGE